MSAPSSGGKCEKAAGVAFIILSGLESSILSKDILPLLGV